MDNKQKMNYQYEYDYKKLIIEMVQSIDETKDKRCLIQIYTILHMYIEKRER